MNWGKPMSSEYTKAANPDMRLIKANILFNQRKKDESHLITMDFSDYYGSSYRMTSPALMASFIYVQGGDSLTFSSYGSSNVFSVVHGSGSISSFYDETPFDKFDALAIPFSKEFSVKAKEDCKIYWVTDEPLLNYMGVQPIRESFKPTKYSYRDYVLKEVEFYNSQPNAELHNRNGILLSNEMCPETKTITPTMWALYNEINPGRVQPPHKHNSIALDLCLYAPEKGGVYTLMSDKIDENGNLIHPKRFDWTSGGAFVTPPAWWHSHHNEAEDKAVVFPIQDAGLYTYLRTLQIKFAK